MADDKTKTKEDRKLINMTEDYEVAYWTKKFGITEERLAAVVRRVGHSAEDVRAYLEKRLGAHGGR